MAHSEGEQSLDYHLTAFTAFYSDLMNLRSVESLELAIGDAEAKLGTHLDMGKLETTALMDGLLSAAKQTRRELTADLSELHHRLSLVFAGLESHSDDRDALLSRLKKTNRWLVELQVTVKHKAAKRDVEKYFEELERLRSELLKISDGTENIAQTFLRTLENERKLTKQLEQETLRHEKSEEKYRKAKSAFEDLKGTYQELFKKHEALIKQNALLKDQVSEK